MRNEVIGRGSVGSLVAAFAMASVGCGVESPQSADEGVGTTVGALQYPGGWQDVEQYVATNGVSSTFVRNHAGPVGYRNGGCSGTLIGDGLFLTVAHCVSTSEVGNFWRFNYQLDQNDVLRPFDTYNVVQLLEDNPDEAQFGVTDHALLRMHGNPENEYGFTTMEARGPDPAFPIVLIGHPGIPRSDDPDAHTSYKTVVVPTVNCVSTSGGVPFDMHYTGYRSYGGSSGSGLLDSTTGRLIGLHRSNSISENLCPAGGTGRGNVITRDQMVSDFLDGDHGSGRLYSFSATGLNQHNWTQRNWTSDWHHLVPGRYRGLATKEMFFYDSRSGAGQFYQVKSSGITAMGPRHVGLNTPNSPWGQVVPVQVDTTPPQELLMLNTLTGARRIYRTDGAGSLTLIWSSPVPTTPPASAPRLAVAGKFRPAQTVEEVVFYDPKARRLTLETLSLGALTFEVSALTGVSSTITIMLTGDFRAGNGDELLLYDRSTRQVTVVWFEANGTMHLTEPATLPGGLATQLGTGAVLSGRANLLAYVPSANNVYANVAENTGAERYFRVFTEFFVGREFTSVADIATESGERRSYSKVIVADFLTQGVPNVMFYARYRE